MSRDIVLKERTASTCTISFKKHQQSYSFSVTSIGIFEINIELCLFPFFILTLYLVFHMNIPASSSTLEQSATKETTANSLTIL